MNTNLAVPQNQNKYALCQTVVDLLLQWEDQHHEQAQARDVLWAPIPEDEEACGAT